MAIGDKIKEHRKNLGITQKELADTLGVSVQAVSKWETGSGFPDVSALVPLARELHITTDELLDFQDRRKELENLWHKTLMTYGNGSKELYDFICASLKEFPEDETLLLRRVGCARIHYEKMKTNDTDRQEWFRKHKYQLSVLIKNYPEWNWTINEMVRLLVAANKKKDAVSYAYRAKEKKDRDQLLKLCLEGDELRNHRQTLIDQKFRELLVELSCDDPEFLDTAEMLIQTLIPDGNFLYYCNYLMMIEIKRAEMCVSEKKFDQALCHLEKAFTLARKNDGSLTGNFTCPIFDTIYVNREIEDSNPSLTEQFLHIVQEHCDFNILRHRNTYKLLIRQAEVCKEYENKGFYNRKPSDEVALSLSEFVDMMDMAKEDLAATGSLAVTEALVVRTASGNIYRCVLTDPLSSGNKPAWEMAKVMREECDVEIRSVICLRECGFFTIPREGVLRLFCTLHRNNLEATMLLSGNKELLKRKVKDAFPTYLWNFLYCKPDAVELFKTLKYDGKSCNDLLKNGRRILAEKDENGELTQNAEIMILRTDTGNIYRHYSSDLLVDPHFDLINELVEKKDTFVTEIVCMMANGGLDLGSFKFRERLYDLDERNGAAKILLQGFDSLHFNTLLSCFPPKKLENLSKQNERNIRIKRLERERVEDYLALFDRISSGPLVCYCANFHRTAEEVDEGMRAAINGSMREYDREEGRRFVLEGRIEGYLVYRDEQIIGWCQAKDKTGYKFLSTHVTLADDKPGEVLGISCLVIEEEHCREGIASILMDYIANDAKNRGFKRLEAYPSRKCLWSEQIFNDMIRFYEKNGFTTVVQRDDWRLMQKTLS